MPFRVRPAKPFTEEFRAIARRQLSHATAFLQEQPEGPHEAIHNARKKFKRLRALYRLIQPDAKEFRRRENARIRDMAGTLSTVRDATALVETLNYLAGEASSPEELKALAFASKVLTERRDRIAAEETDLPAKIAAAVAECREASAALDELSLEDSPKKTAKRLAKAWRKQRLRAHEALEACEENADAEAFHALRKSGQTYWIHLSLLNEVWPSAMAAKQREAKQLVDILGHEHDLSVLTELVNESPELFGDSDTLALLIGAIITRQQALRREALERAEEVFADSAADESALIAALWEKAATAPRREREKAKRKNSGNGQLAHQLRG
ncbi:CHAD domain-containing protein [Rhizobium sp. LCM 4573]|uniref:CHAD domain-containing protein n=1 Tax=Rhizobium sp. LCM 4573 TaxID=1848291 RepID=UPI0008D95627|nr:CHAD domain-containing protein [Rhizobium sp. LCM 4573]OHV84729.1 metal-binding protein [Rhizobium sp. LCM 4573]